MFCSKCGDQLPEGAVFCQKCGTKVDDDISRLYRTEATGTLGQSGARKTYIPEWDKVKRNKQFIQLQEFIQRVFDNLKKLPYQMVMDKVKGTPKISGIGASLIGIICIACISFALRKPGREVRESYLEQYSVSVTVEDAFEAFFENGKWKDYKEDGDQYVVFTGKCFYLEEKADIKIRFKIKDEYFYVTDMEIDGEPQSDFVISAFLGVIYEEYY